MTTKDDEPEGDSEDALKGKDEVVCDGPRKLTRGDYHRALCHIGYDPAEARKRAEKLKPAERTVAVAPPAVTVQPAAVPDAKSAGKLKARARVIGEGG